jgi:hypothetical protein
VEEDLALKVHLVYNNSHEEELTFFFFFFFLHPVVPYSISKTQVLLHLL